MDPPSVALVAVTDPTGAVSAFLVATVVAFPATDLLPVSLCRLFVDSMLPPRGGGRRFRSLATAVFGELVSPIQASRQLLPTLRRGCSALC